MTESFLNGKVTLLRGDCLELLPTLEENSIDACVTDPPYHLTSGKGAVAVAWDTMPKNRGTPRITKKSVGFMGKQWDGGDIAFRPELWAEVLRVLKPGAHLLAFSGTRTYHRMACAIEDAGFEIRDCIFYCYGSGFPKSHDVSKGIDRLYGAERQKIVTGKPVKRIIPGSDQNKVGWEKNNGREYVPGVEVPATDEAAEWQGWGSALKPAVEPICLARKPLSESSIAANVLKWGTGAINVDGCRIGVEGGTTKGSKPQGEGRGIYGAGLHGACEIVELNKGRWPANLIHDGSEEVVERFPETTSGELRVKSKARGWNGDGGTQEWNGASGDSGSAARFFYTAKADADDRLGSKHPTVKPLDLMQYLVRLVTPKSGTTLDPFGGTGSTAEAAFREGMGCVLIEREPEYQADIVKRMGLCLSGPDERRAASVKQLPPDDLPMFGGGI